MTVHVRPASLAELQEFGSWAEREGWQPGIGDLEAFHATDPEGFLVAVDGDRLEGMISAVRYDGDFAFLGFYIVSPELRGEGIGHQLGAAALEHVGERLLGLDGVPAQIASYEENGFRVAHWTPRWSGDAGAVLESLRAIASPEDLILAPIDSRSPLLATLIDFDAEHVPAARGAFVRAWLDPMSERVGFVTMVREEITGYAVVRPTKPDGSRIGPLFAHDEATARALMKVCAETALNWDGPMSIDVPEPNSAGTALMESLGLSISFTCARMYRGEDPSLPLGNIYGNTTYELG